jgi:hypothetical protein
MRDDRQTLHDLVDQAPDEQLPRLLDLVSRFLHPVGSPSESESITFVPTTSRPVDPEAARRADIERRRRRLLGEGPFETSASRLVRQYLLPALGRLGLSEENLIAYPGGYGGSVTAEGFQYIERHWQEETSRHRLSAFALQGQEIVTYKRAQISEAGTELLYRVRVLTPAHEAEFELHIPLR